MLEGIISGHNNIRLRVGNTYQAAAGIPEQVPVQIPSHFFYGQRIMHQYRRVHCPYPRIGLVLEFSLENGFTTVSRINLLESEHFGNIPVRLFGAAGTAVEMVCITVRMGQVIQLLYKTFHVIKAHRVRVEQFGHVRAHLGI